MDGVGGGVKMIVRNAWAYRVSGAHEAVDINGQGGRSLSWLLGVGLLLACHSDELWWWSVVRVVVVVVGDNSGDGGMGGVVDG